MPASKNFLAKLPQFLVDATTFQQLPLLDTGFLYGNFAPATWSGKLLLSSRLASYPIWDRSILEQYMTTPLDPLKYATAFVPNLQFGDRQTLLTPPNMVVITMQANDGATLAALATIADYLNAKKIFVCFLRRQSDTDFALENQFICLGLPPHGFIDTVTDSVDFISITVDGSQFVGGNLLVINIAQLAEYAVTGGGNPHSVTPADISLAHEQASLASAVPSFGQYAQHVYFPTSAAYLPINSLEYARTMTVINSVVGQNVGVTAHITGATLSATIAQVAVDLPGIIQDFFG